MWDTLREGITYPSVIFLYTTAFMLPCITMIGQEYVKEHTATKIDYNLEIVFLTDLRRKLAILR